MLDGVYTLDSGEPRFVPLDPPTTEDVEDLVERIAGAALTWLARQGIDDDELPAAYRALGRSSLGGIVDAHFRHRDLPSVAVLRED